MRTTNSAGALVGRVMLACAFLLAFLVAPAAASPSLDGDGDRLDDRWETLHGFPIDRKNTWWSPDRDGVLNLREFRNDTNPRDEDTDDDGQDDADELRTKTKIRDADSDDDRRTDGDEDHDRDGIANEDEDDAAESCAYDDDDRDGDHVSDEDENDLGLKPNDADSDDDRLPDGAEDRDRDGVSNEDEDDADDDRCRRDRDRDGKDDEDEGDRLGTITSYDAQTRTLLVSTLAGATLTVRVDEATEVEFEDTDEDGTLADLRAGLVVAELEIDDDTGFVEEIELYAA